MAYYFDARGVRYMILSYIIPLLMLRRVIVYRKKKWNAYSRPHISTAIGELWVS